MKRLLFCAAVLAGGLALSQVLFTVLVYNSNLAFHNELSRLKEAGYLVVPNELVMQGLDSFIPAFCGASFFTLTAGAGLSLAAFFTGWLKIRIFRKSRFYNFLAATAWLGAAAACNLDGWNLAVTMVFILVPATVFSAVVHWLPSSRRGDGYIRVVHIVVVAAAAIGWLPCLQPDVFLDIRDRVLLSNSFGQTVNEFYYTYTLYPVEMVNTPENRLINACGIEDKESNNNVLKLSEKLVEFDYLPVSGSHAGGISVRAGPSGFKFAWKGKMLMEKDHDAFFSSPARTLGQFSKKTDNSRFLRRFTFAGLTSAFPLGLYIFLHAGLCLMLWFIKSIPARSSAASLICLGLAAAFLLPFYLNDGKFSDQAAINASLESENSYERRNALKAIAGQNLDPMSFDIEPELADSGYIPVRYWLARAIGNSRNIKAIRILKNLTNDPSPNVACMAYASLARTGRSNNADFIRGRIEEINHWYVQQYAYNAMRKLGWKQQSRYMNGSRLP